MAETTIPIPNPPGLPLIGNVGDIDATYPMGSMINMADKYGELYRLYFPGRTALIASSYALVNELCDEKRFRKGISGVLEQVRAATGDGLFTASGPEEANWGIAHRVLTPAFGPMPIADMHDDMADIAAQLAMKWARHGPAHPIMVTDDFTRLALDTLALCSMDHRFNSFYHDAMHPFISAMGEFLVESGNRSRRPLPSIFYREADRRYDENVAVMRKTAMDVVQARKANPSDRKDLLSAMLEGVDPKTGRKMTDESICENLITFLVAGHETTAGTLSFAFYHLLKHPEAYRKAQQEVDQVVGEGRITPQHVSKLQYIQAVLRETLRLTPTIGGFNVNPIKDEIIGGKYAVTPKDLITIFVQKSQVDPAVHGETAEEFHPERMLEDNFNRMSREYPNFWKPFGNGSRACIGRPFAWQEMVIALSMLLQNFNFRFDDPSYSLEKLQTLTVKPKDFYMRAVLRNGLTATQLEHRLNGTVAPPNGTGAAASKGANAGEAQAEGAQGQGRPMSIFYGSNSGTCEALARRLATDAPSHGFTATVVDSLDTAHQNLPAEQPVVIVTASYEGEPPDNAALFCNWIQGLDGDKNKQEAAAGTTASTPPLDKVSYAVFGCGHHDWAQTFHKIPKMVDATLSRLGAARLAPLGTADAAESDLFTRFETWEDETLWPALRARYGTAEKEGGRDGENQSLQGGLVVDVSTPRSSTLRQDVKEAVVVAARDLTTTTTTETVGSAKRHLEIQLPSDRSYAAGDYLAVLPINHKDAVHRVLRRFGLPWDAHLTIRAAGGATAAATTPLPTGHPVPASDVLAAYVELSQPATRRGLSALAEAATSGSDRDELTRLAATPEGFAEAQRRRLSLLDLLEQHPGVDLPLATFLSLLPPLRVRQYSISSSPLVRGDRCTLTYSVVDAPALSSSSSKSEGEGGKGKGRRHVGVASSYLASLQPGDRLHVAVRPSHSASFRLPVDAERTPLVMIAAGSGIAPFRGFVQERAAMLGAADGEEEGEENRQQPQQKKKLAPALLFFGCRDPGADDLYREELDRWEALGAVEVRRAYSRRPEASGGCAHVQDRLWADRADVQALWEAGARVYVCGSRGVADNVREMAIRMFVDGAKVNHGKELSIEEATERFEAVRHERFATDVFD